MIWPFGDLPMFGFDLIMADPPWPFALWSEAGEGKSAQAQYETMDLDAIADMPVGHLAAPDCILILWTTWPMLIAGTSGNASYSPAGWVMKRWGFRYATGGAWHKRTPGGKTHFGTGYWLRSACEPFLVGVNGDPAHSRSVRNLIDGQAREHSRKPEAAYTWAEEYAPSARRLDLFSRETRSGWTAWGREVGKFDAS